MLYVSFTCIPSRINNLEYIIDSLNNQTMLPDIVVINYPKKCLRLKSNYDINFLNSIINKIKTKFNIIINETHDYGPITKIYPLVNLGLNDNDIIIVIDDDNYYNNNLIETLFSNFTMEGQTKAICVSGLMYPRKMNSPYYCVNYGNNCELMEAAFGYIIKKSFLNKNLRHWTITADTFEEVKENNFYNSFLSDDYVISRYLDSKKIPKKVINYNIDLNKNNCFDKQKCKSNDSLCGLGHNLDKYLKSEIELKLRSLV